MGSVFAVGWWVAAVQASVHTPLLIFGVPLVITGVIVEAALRQRNTMEPALPARETA